MKKLLVDSTPMRLQLSESSDGGFWIARGEFGRCDVPTENRRVYPRSLWEREVKKIQAAIKQGKVLGEAEHPADGRTSLKRVSHLITDLQITDDGQIIGEARILDNEHGRQLQSILKAGGSIGVSSRGMGSTSMNEDGYEIVQEDYSYMTHDFVADPAVKTSYPEFKSESKELKAKLASDEPALQLAEVTPEKNEQAAVSSDEIVSGVVSVTETKKKSDEEEEEEKEAGEEGESDEKLAPEQVSSEEVISGDVVCKCEPVDSEAEKDAEVSSKGEDKAEEEESKEDSSKEKEEESKEKLDEQQTDPEKEQEYVDAEVKFLKDQLTRLRRDKKTDTPEFDRLFYRLFKLATRTNAKSESVSASGLILSEVARLVMPFVIESDIAATIKGYETQIEEANQKLEQALNESKKHKEAAIRAAKVAKEIGLHLHMETSVRGTKNENAIREIIGDVKKFESHEHLLKAVNEAKTRLDQVEAEVAKKNEVVSEDSKALGSLKKELEESNKALKEATEIAKKYALKSYVLESVKGSANAAKILELTESAKTKAEVDSLIKRHAVEPAASREYNSIRNRFSKLSTTLVEDQIRTTGKTVVANEKINQSGVDKDFVDLFGVTSEQLIEL